MKIDSKVKELEDQIKDLEAEIIELEKNIKSKNMELEDIIEKDVDNCKKLKDLLSMKDLEINKLNNIIQTNETQTIAKSEAFNSLKCVKDILKQDNKKLKAANNELMKRIDIKDSELERIKANSACEKFNLTHKQFLVHTNNPIMKPNKEDF